MKKYRVWIMLVVFVFSVCIFIPVATAITDADACNSGDHVWLLAESDYSGYGGLEYFNVSSCADVPYSHNHYYITGQVKHHYECLYCEATMTETTTYRDYEMGPLCTVYDPGR